MHLLAAYVYAFVPSSRLEGNKVVDMILGLTNILPAYDIKKYVLGLDNYFTDGGSTTAWARRGLPPKEIKCNHDKWFNTAYQIND